MKKRQMKKIVMAIVVIFVILVAMWLVRRQRLANSPIDCMPPLSEQEAEACRRAEELGNPNIVY